MKKLFEIITVFGLLFFTASNSVIAQNTTNNTITHPDTAVSTTSANEQLSVNSLENLSGQTENKQSLHRALKQKFIEGGPGFMTSILICLILGLSIAIERIIYLNLATINNKKFLERIEKALNSGGIEAAKEVCRNTRGPLASIFYHGLDHAPEGLEVVEKTVVAYGGIQTRLLEKGLVWIALFIALGPMLGLLGTVIGIVKAFDALEIAGDFSPLLVASGIKVALITTIGGLIVAMILQIFYNYSVSKIDSIVNNMEDASISLIDLLVKYNSKIITL